MGQNFIRTTGANGSYASAPEAVGAIPTGTTSVAILARLRLPDWTPSAQGVIASQFGSSPNGSIRLDVATNGTLVFTFIDAGPTGRAASSNVLGFTDNTIHWVAAELLPTGGAAGVYRIKFYKSNDNTNDFTAVTWTTDSTTDGAAAANLQDNTRIIEIGSRNSGASNPLAADFYRVVILSGGIAGTTVFDANPANVAAGATSFTESSSNAATVTLNGTAAVVAGPSSSPAILLPEFGFF